MIGVIIIVVIVIVCIYCPPLGAAAASGLAAGEALAAAGSAAAAIGLSSAAAGLAAAAATATATGIGLAVGTAALAAAGAAAIAGSIAAGVDAIETQKQNEQTAQEIEELRQQAVFANTESHGEQVSVEWNYMEKITTDFDRDTMTCKRCISARKCKKTKWHIFSDRNCGSWGKWEEPRCNELKF